MNSEKMIQNTMAMPTDRMPNQGMPNAGFLSLAGLMAAAGRNMGQGNPFIGGSQGPLPTSSAGGGHGEGPMTSMGNMGSGMGMGNTVLSPPSSGNMGQETSASLSQGTPGMTSSMQQSQPPTQQQPGALRPSFPGLLNNSDWNWGDFSPSQEGANALLERGRSRNWTYEETLELIGLYTSEEWQGKFGSEKKNHRAIWASLAAALSKRKDVSGDEARQRLNNLKALYNRTRRQLLAGEITSPQWEYWEPLHSFLGRPQPFLPLPPASPLPQFPSHQPFQPFQPGPQNPHHPMRGNPEGPNSHHPFPPAISHNAHPSHNHHALLGALGLAPPFAGFHSDGNPFHKNERNMLSGSDCKEFEGEDRKVDLCALTGSNFPPGLNENSLGSGEGQGACDEVSVPLSPEQFLSEEMDQGVSPSTPSQRPESYKLRHNNHLTLVLESLAGDESFMDVTLTAQGRAIKAHKSILSAVSPYFKSVLKENPCQHPIIIMPRDIRFEELNNIISYVYKGEMTVAAEELSSLLKTAEILQVTGLSPTDSGRTASGIISQMQGLPSGMFANTSTNNVSSPAFSSKRTKQSHSQSRPDSKERQQQQVDSQARIDPLEFLNADMTCVKEEIPSDTEEGDQLNFPISKDFPAGPGSSLSEPSDSLGPPDSSHISPSNRRKSLGGSPRPLEDPTGKPFNPGETKGVPIDSPSTPASPTGPHVCPHCSETHRPTDALQSHLRLKHPSKLSFVCSCGRVFVRQTLFSDHQKKCKG